MAKRIKEQEGEDRDEIKPTLMNLDSTVSASSSTEQSDCVEKLANTQKAPCRTDWSSTGKLDSREHNQDAASSSQGWQTDAVLDEGTRNLVATEEDQERLKYLEETVSTRQVVVSGNSGTEGNDKVWPRRLLISTNYVLHMEKIFSIVRQISPTDQMKELDVNTAIWNMYLSLSLFNLRFILVETSQKICDLPRINRRNL